MRRIDEKIDKYLNEAVTKPNYSILLHIRWTDIMNGIQDMIINRKNYDDKTIKKLINL